MKFANAPEKEADRRGDHKVVADVSPGDLVPK